uniref:Uncharacterized protein n=1 Tax=uncultured marine thaumarchaeote KM3_99_A02 TaxID=1456353 RepID=A0A075I361_9ARCH|nr:hypothetical protein [uncultured marine thaumarchaeote KM3_99_A02]
MTLFDLIRPYSTLCDLFITLCDLFITLCDLFITLFDLMRPFHNVL